MALRLLLTNLEGGLNFYPNHNTPSTAGGFNYGGSTSVFDNKLFRQKSFKFGQGTTFDRPNGGFSNEPFVTSPTIDILSGNPGLETTINTFTDGFIRGGAITHAERLITDGERIGRFLISPKGLAFITKQVGLQLTNPKISRPGRGISRANQRTYNVGVNTLASVVSAGTGLYVKREGLLPTAHAGYAQAKQLFEDNDNRLINLFEDHIEQQTTVEGLPEKERSRLGQFFYNVGQGLKKAKKFILGGSDGETLYAYNGGPGSLFGIGRTRIKKYAPYVTDIGENGIPRGSFTTGYLDGSRFSPIALGLSSGVSNVFVANFRELNGVNVDLFPELHESLQEAFIAGGFGEQASGNGGNPLAASKNDIKDSKTVVGKNADSVELGFRYSNSNHNFLPGGKFIINQENLQEDSDFETANQYLLKPSKFILSNKILNTFKTFDFGGLLSIYNNRKYYGLLYDDGEDYSIRYPEYQYDPEAKEKLSLENSKTIGTRYNRVFSTRRIGVGGEMSEERSNDQPFLPEGGYTNYIDSVNFISEIERNPSLSDFSRHNSYFLKRTESHVESYKTFFGGELPDPLTVLTTDLDTANGQYNPEDILLSAPKSIIFGEARSIKGLKDGMPGYTLSLEKLAYNPFTFQSNKEINIGGNIIQEAGKEALVPWIDSYTVYEGKRGNVALFQKYKDPFGDESTTEFFEDSTGFTRFKSAEYDKDLESINLNPNNSNTFDPKTYFSDNPNYSVLFKTVQDFRKIKKDTLGDDYAQPSTDYQQVTNHGKKYYREQRVNTGNPGKRLAGTKGKNISGGDTDSYDMYDEDTIDRINALDIFHQKDNNYETKDSRDLIRFRIEALDGDDPSQANTMIFRAFLDSFGDNYTGAWNSFKYNGRAENFYTYSGFDRKLSFSFKIAAQSRHEMIPLYRKLNYLVSQTAPDYSGTRMRGNFCRLTIGALIDRTPGFFTTVGLKWNKDYPWDISLNHLEGGEDKDGASVMPHVLDVSCQFTPIHNFIPKKSISDSPFILSHENNRTLPRKQKWYKFDKAPSLDKAFMHHKNK
mgnify:FL=1|tara:strand:+ start:1793 stop:4927 length:3135 start_codon:yes stop_codon:yes gene_type:complete